MTSIEPLNEVYVKEIDDHVIVQLSYNNKTENEVECSLTFYNRLDNRVIINQSDTTNDTKHATSHENSHGINGKDKDHNNSWISGIWGSSSTSESSSVPKSNDVKLFLGYVQLFGYVVLNYKYGLDDTNSISVLNNPPRNSTWWLNKDYMETYADMDDELFNRNLSIDTSPFIYDNLVNPMIIGDKIGGVNDLIVEEDNNCSIDSNKRYYLNDLIYNFNSYKKPKPEDNIEQDGKVYLKEFNDGILPFYTTSQSLLFSDLTLLPKTSKKFHFKFPNVIDLPPSYNTTLTGLTGDQGLISIRYLLILGFLKMNQFNEMLPISIYYPFTVHGERRGRDDRWLQPDYLQQITIDKSWKIKTDDDVKNDINDVKNEVDLKSDVIDLKDNKDTRESFLDDLDKLINSDLHNIPKMSTSERKKSFPSLHDAEDSKPGLIPQLPHHLKNQYQILVNNNQLCLVTISKPYYHLGEDLSFTIDLNTKNIPNKQLTRVVGVTVHLEAHEIFHLKDNKRYTNVYRVSQNIKINSFASSMINSVITNDEQLPSLLNGYLNIPNFLCQQFQCSKLMDLKYFVVFKFNLMQFDKHELEVQQASPTGDNTNDISNGNQPETMHGNEDSSTDVLRDGNSNETNDEIDESNQATVQSSDNEDEITKQLIPDLHLQEPTSSHEISKCYEFIHAYTFDNTGNDFTFRIPIPILP